VVDEPKDARARRLGRKHGKGLFKALMRDSTALVTVGCLDADQANLVHTRKVDQRTPERNGGKFTVGSDAEQASPVKA